MIDKASNASLSIAHFAPERALFNALSNHSQNASYECYDLFPEKYKFADGVIKKCNLVEVDASFEESSYDLVLHNHVLEHVPSDVEKLILSLNKLVRPGGLHVFTIPMRKGAFDEDLSDSLTPEQRRKRFGQEDHVRIFSASDSEQWLKNLLHRDKVVFRLNEFLTAGMADLFGVRKVFDNDQNGALNGSTVFFYRNAI
jgi:SAM-dependent methyltransferase